jgi:gluconate 5-dehydrogenase
VFRLDGRVALVTGSSRGLGWAIARALSAAGAIVVLHGRDTEALRARQQELAATGAATDVVRFDVTDSEAGARAIGQIAERHGRLDVLVNNAGVILRKPLAEVADSDWQATLATDLTSCFTLARAAAAVMVPQGRGSIIMISSIVASVTRPQIAAYTAAKGAVSALARALAVELGPHGVRCNAIAPGYFRTEGTAPIVETELGRQISARTPLGRWGNTEEIGGAAVFLASDAASYVNGTVLTVDGGLTAAL